MDLSEQSLSLIGSVASIISLPLSVYAILTAWGVRSALKARSLDKQVRSLFDELIGIPSAKSRLTSSQRRKIVSLLKYVDDFYLSGVPWRDRKAKRLTNRLKKELQSDPHRDEIVHMLVVLEEQLFLVTRH